MPSLPFKISVLVFITNIEGNLLMLQRAKSPNKGLWSPIGGKLDMDLGESPGECAIRETWEETRFSVNHEDLHLFGIISEKSYEGSGHWLMFLYHCKKPIDHHPQTMNEGHFEFFPRQKIDELPVPATDRTGLWPIYDKFKEKFVVMRADCTPGKPLEIFIEETLSDLAEK